jgi:hypothetical protein
MPEVKEMPNSQLIHIARDAATATDLERELAKRLDGAVRLLGRFRDYACDQYAEFPAHSPGAHHNPLWAEVAGLLSQTI